MATQLRRDMSLEEFDVWVAAQRNVEDVKESTLEEGGPRVSLVPAPTSVPVDFVPDEIQIPAPATTGLHAVSFAYGLRVRSASFAAAWDAAQQLAVGRLSALAFDRAIHGGVQQVYRDGDLIAERQAPSERLLMWLLARLDPKRFAAPWERRKDDNSDPQADAQQAFPTMLDALQDVAAD